MGRAHRSLPSRLVGAALAAALAWGILPPAQAQPAAVEPAPAAATPAPEPEGTEPPGIPAPPPPEPVPAVTLTVAPPAHSSGQTLVVGWGDAPAPEGMALLRSLAADGPFAVVADDLPAGKGEVEDTLTNDPREEAPPAQAFYRLAFKDAAAVAARKAVDAANLEMLGAGASAPPEVKARLDAATAVYVDALLTRAGPAVEGRPADSWFNVSRLPLLLIIFAMAGLILYFTRQARLGREIYIRRIPGVDAIEEAVGRATEMGNPVLYIPGIGEFQEIQTIASLLILGRVAEIVASYDSDIIVTCTYPIVREVADESVRQGYFQAGRPDAYKPFNVRFISSEQFAFTASTNGIILREKPAANIYLGQFFAESLILSETGFVNKSIQIAGTAETSQIPFFVTACDYTLIGEELYAVSAYLTREPRLTSSLKASDWVRLVLIITLAVGALEILLTDGAYIRDFVLMRLF